MVSWLSAPSVLRMISGRKLFSSVAHIDMDRREVWGRQRIFNWMPRLKHAFSTRSEKHLGPVLPLRGCSVLLHPSRYWKEGLRSPGPVSCNVVRVSRGGGKASSEEASVSVHRQQLSEEESWIKGTSSARDGVEKVTRLVGEKSC